MAENSNTISRDQKIEPKRLSLAFRRFKEKHSKLSTIHWTHVVGVEGLRKALENASPSARLVEALNLPVRVESFGLHVSAAHLWFDDYLNRCRLHILAICAANLEAFLKDVARAFVATIGHVDKPGCLSEVGKAMAAPIISRSTVPDMLSYAEHLFKIDFGGHKKVWQKAYKLRCMLVHNGGMIDRRNSSALGVENPRMHQPPNYTWIQLKSDLEAAYEIAATTNLAIGTGELRLQEIGFELREMKETNTLPTKDNVWHYFHLLGIAPPNRKQREKLIANFF